MTQSRVGRGFGSDDGPGAAGGPGRPGRPQADVKGRRWRERTPEDPGSGRWNGRRGSIDDTIKATHGYAKQGAGDGYTGVKGLNALVAIVSTPLSAPVVARTRLRRGGTNSARSAARFVADALVTTRACGGNGLITVRADSAYYEHDVIAAARRGGARFSITARMNPPLSSKRSRGSRNRLGSRFHYPNAIWGRGRTTGSRDRESVNPMSGSSTCSTQAATRDP